MKKNNVDQVFKDRLKDYKETPEERIWESISASLDKKKSRRRIIPLWWKLGGAAAALALLLYVLLPAGPETLPNRVTDTEKPAVIEESPAARGQELPEILPEEDAVAEQGETATDKSDELREESVIETAIAKQDSSPMKRNDQKAAATALTGDNKVATDNNNALVSQDNNTRMVSDKEAGNINEELDSRIAGNALQKEIVEDKILKNPNALQETPAVAEVSEEQQEVSIDEKEKKSIFEAIEEQEEETVAEATTNRWSVGPTIAPVYFNTLTEGSPIHSNFVANTKSGNVNLSYGVAVSYQITDKLSVRSGLHRVDYGYDTDEIRFSSSLTAATSALIDNIDYNANSRTLVVESQASRGIQQSAVLDANEVSAPSPAREGRMVQDFGYLEVPMELQYNLVDKKVGVNLIGGLSSLFLMENSVTLVADNTATSMGEANNIN